MSQVWVNGKFFETHSDKINKWKPAPAKEKALWGLCRCGEQICEGDAVGMYGEHEHVVCYSCWLAGALAEAHLDCAGLKFPDATLSQ